MLSLAHRGQHHGAQRQESAIEIARASSKAVQFRDGKKSRRWRWPIDDAFCSHPSLCKVRFAGAWPLEDFRAFRLSDSQRGSSRIGVRACVSGKKRRFGDEEKVEAKRKEEAVARRSSRRRRRRRSRASTMEFFLLRRLEPSRARSLGEAPEGTRDRSPRERRDGERRESCLCDDTHTNAPAEKEKKREE